MKNVSRALFLLQGEGLLDDLHFNLLYHGLCRLPWEGQYRGDIAPEELDEALREIHAGLSSSTLRTRPSDALRQDLLENYDSMMAYAAILNLKEPIHFQKLLLVFNVLALRLQNKI